MSDQRNTPLNKQWPPVPKATPPHPTPPSQQQKVSQPEPGRIVPVAEPVLDAVLQELRAIRKLLERPKDTACRELRGEVIDPPLEHGEKV